jgi:hypothetical protein
MFALILEKIKGESEQAYLSDCLFWSSNLLNDNWYESNTS